MSIFISRVRELFDYHEDGFLIWRIRPYKSRVEVGKIAGGPDGSHGYWKVQIDCRQYPVHRIIWLWHYGEMPKNQIDHRNGIRHDNRIENLREATIRENGQNRGKGKNNTSGHIGVSWHEGGKSWEVRIQVNKKSFYIGNFKDYEQACKAQEEAKTNLHPFQPMIRSSS